MRRVFRFNNNNGDDNMKFRILDESTINSMIEFLDDMQLQAVEDHDEVLLLFCQKMINELINADEIVDNTDTMDNFSEDSLSRIYDYLTQIKNYTEDPQKKGREDRTKKNKKETYKPHIEDVAEYMSLEEIQEFLLDDPTLTDDERFELYYEEHRRVERHKKNLEDEKNSTSFNKMLKSLKISPHDIKK